MSTTVSDLDKFKQHVLTDPLARDVWLSKYRYYHKHGESAEETVEDTHRRVIAAVYAKDPDKTAAIECLELVKSGILIPAGRINAGAGTNRAVTELNCYVMPTIMDSMPGIQMTIAKAALTLQQGGGIGTDYSTVRPAGAIVKRTGSVASGVIPFMDQQNGMSTTIVSAGWRRGAMMGTLRCDHPDLWNENQFDTMTNYEGREVFRSPSFISAKREKGRLTQFNISVLVTDEFMEAVRLDENWDLGFHVPRADGQHVDVYQNAYPFPYDYYEMDNDFNKSEHPTIRKGEIRPWFVYRRVKARQIWDDIMRSNYKYAEPGIIFIDRINERNNLNYCETISCTNPCFTGDTLVWTSDGPQRFDKLAAVGEPVHVLTKLTNGLMAYRRMIDPRKTQKQADLIKVTFECYYGRQVFLRCTPAHNFFLTDGRKVAARDLKVGDSIDSVCEFTRVLAVDVISEKEDVYCGTVEESGRFFVAIGDEHYEGVLVSNCAEQPLPPNGCCDLGSINAAFLIKDPFTEKATFDYSLFKHAAKVGIRMLDNVLEIANFPLREQKIESDKKRRIGLGITGWADALLQLGVKYGSKESIELSQLVANALKCASYEASSDLAKERGCFPLFEKDKFLNSYNVQGLPQHIQDKIAQQGIRNGVCNTIAPNGTISLYIGNVSSAHEPVFSFEKMSRKVRQADGSLKEYISVDYGLRLYEHMFGETRREDLPPYFVSAMDISAEDHIRVHAAWQQSIDASCSKTTNCNPSMSYEHFKDIYKLAYDLGCKGCTTYREDPESGRGSVLQVVKETVKEALEEAIEAATVISPNIADIAISPRPKVLEGRTYKLKWPLTQDNWYITINNEDGIPREMFIVTKSVAHQEWVTALSRTVTAILRRGGELGFLVTELSQVHAASGGCWLEKRYCPSVVAAIGFLLEEEWKRLGLLTPRTVEDTSEASSPTAIAEKVRHPPCPSCNAPAWVKEAGCWHCLSCGHNICS